VITEIHYRPVDQLVSYGLNRPTSIDNSAEEYIEIANISGEPVSLDDSLTVSNTWRLAGGIDLKFPGNVTLHPGELALLVNFSPSDPTPLAAFRNKFGVPAGLKIYGAFSGRLNNDTDAVILRKPVLLGGTNLVLVTVDRVDYQDQAPWPSGADGLGYTLQRWNPAALGNEPSNWVAAAPTPGTLTPTNGTPPRFVAEPADQLLPTGQPATLAATAGGTAPLFYQWTFNGRAISRATNNSLVFSNITLLDAGSYQLLAYNAFGLVVSRTISIDVHLPPTITKHPTNIMVRIVPDTQAAPSTNATFYVGAVSRSSVQYQWRFNGIDLPGARLSSLTITNVTTNHLGYFSAVVSDGISSVETEPAWLYPLVRPQITQSPLPQDVPVNSRVTLGIEYSGWPPPYSVEWRLGSLPLITNQVNSVLNFFSFTAPSFVVTQQYRAVVRNLASLGGAASGFVRIVTLPDADSDGLPDAWETAYALDPGSAADRMLDGDADGMRNWEEYEAGTDPTNPFSYLRIDSRSVQNQMQLNFGAVSNRTYQVLFAETLADPLWRKLADVSARPTNRTELIVDPVGRTNRYYRVRTPAD
jgi:hypothetical protein